MNILVDFSKAKETDKFTSTGLAPEGWHGATITKAELKEKETETQIIRYINFEFSLDNYDQKCWYNCFINGYDNNSALFTILKAIGYNPEGKQMKLNQQMFLHKKLMIEIKHRKYHKNGEELIALQLYNVKPISFGNNQNDNFENEDDVWK